MAGGELSEAIVSDLVPAAVWSNTPLNGVVAESVSTPVMDVGLWPSLGDSTAVKSSSSELLQEVSGNSIDKVEANAIVNPVVNDENTTTTTSVNNVASSGPRSTKRVGGSSGAYVASNGIVTMRSAPSPEATQITSGIPITVPVESNSKDQKESIRGNDQHYQRNPYRIGGNGGYHSRGNGGGDYGGKVDPRGNQDWNQQHRNVQQHRGGYRRGGYVRPSVHNTPPILPPMPPMPMHPFANNLIYHDAGSMFYFTGQPMVPVPFFPFVDPILHEKILNQINYYFSNENLVKDLFLRRSMDEQGWVSVNLIAGFKKVSSMTDDVQLILHVMRTSVLVEVQGDKMRRRNDWMRWLLPQVGSDLLASQLHGSSSSGELQQQGGGREREAVV